MRESFLGHQKDGAGITMTWNPDYKPSLRSSWHCLPFSSLFLDISAFLSASLCLLFSVSWHFFSVLGDLSKGPCTEFLLRGNHRESFFGFSKVYHFFFRKFCESWILRITLSSFLLVASLLCSSLPCPSLPALPFSILFFFTFLFLFALLHPTLLESVRPYCLSLLCSFLFFFTFLFSILLCPTLLVFTLLFSTLLNPTLYPSLFCFSCMLSTRKVLL